MLKKSFTIALVFTTVCWSMGVATMMPAFAATISAGDLIKASGAAVYYYGGDGMRYVFPTESTYMSWYSDFSTVQTITDAELAAIDIGGNATVRPGTKLVKITTDPKTYAVAPGGVLKHVDSEARAIALYGDGWNTRIIDISDAFWVNYTKGSAIASDVHPDGALVKYDGAATVYYIDAGEKRAVSGGAFTANRFKDADITTIADTITYSDGSGLTEEEGDVTNVAGGASASTGTGLTVALASDTPASGIVVISAARVPFTKINLTASSDGDITVDSLVVERTGLANDLCFSNLDIIDASTNLPINTTSKSLNSQHKATFTKDFVVSAGTTKSIILAGNMSSALATYAGEVPSLSLVEVNLTGNAVVSGTLPIIGNTQSANGTITIGTATVQRGAYGNASTTTASPLEVGKEDYTFFSFSVAAGSAEKVEFSQVKVYQKGSATLGTDVTNLELYETGTKVADGVVDGKYVNFNFDTYTIDKGQTKQFIVKGDVEDGSARVVELGIYKTTDLLVTGVTYGYNITPTYSGTGSSATSPVLQDNEFVIGTGSLKVEKSNTVGAGNITVGTDQEIGAFEFTGKGEPIDITAITLAVTSSTASATDDAFKDFKLVDANGIAVAGPADISSGSVSWTDSFTVPVGISVYKVLATLSTSGSLDADDTIYVSITPSNMTAEGTVTGESVTPSPSSAINANTQTVKTAVLTITKDTMPAASTIIKGSQGTELASWTFDASNSGEDVRVTSVKVSFEALGYNATNTDALTLYDGDTALDPVNDAVTASAMYSTFALAEPMIITKGTSKVVKLKGNISSSARADEFVAVYIKNDATHISAYGKDTGNTAIVTAPTGNTTSGPDLTVATMGTLTISTSSNPPAGILIAGSTGNTMTKIRLKAKYEDLDLNKLKIHVLDGGANNGSSAGDFNDVTSVSIYDGSTLLASHSIPGATGYEFNFDAGTVTIPAGGEKILTVKADISTINVDADNAPGTAAADIIVGIDGEAAGIKTTGNESNTEITGADYETYQGASSSAMIIHKTQPTVTYSETGAALGAATSLTNGSVKLFAYKVAADSANEVLLYRTSFEIATSSGMTSVTNLLIKDQNGKTVGTASDSTKLTFYDDSGAGTCVYTTTFDNPDISVGNEDEAIKVDAGSEKTFYLWGTVTGAATGHNVSVTMLGDSATSTPQTSMGNTTAAVARDANVADGYSENNQGNFVWSDNVKDRSLDTDGSNATAYAQWYNGYTVNGLGSSPTTSAYVIGWSG